MANEELIPAKEFCIYHQVELSFISSLNERGLIEVNLEDEDLFIPVNQMPQLEKIVRFHEMDINLEGIEVITRLLDQMEKQRMELERLINRLRLYEAAENFAFGENLEHG